MCIRDRDNGVISFFNDHLLENTNDQSWNVLIGHMLGMDHVGHKFGPNHFTMKQKQLQIDKFIREIMDSIDDDTLLVIMGDHGMDPVSYTHLDVYKRQGTHSKNHENTRWSLMT